MTDLGVKHLAALPKLHTLAVPDTRTIGPTGVAHLKGLGGLKSLNLRGTLANDDAVDVLCGLQSLTYLNIRNTAITQQGHDRIKDALPKCNIEWEPPKKP